MDLRNCSDRAFFDHPEQKGGLVTHECRAVGGNYRLFFLSPGAAVERICTNGDSEVRCASPVMGYLYF